MLGFRKFTLKNIDFKTKSTIFFKFQTIVYRTRDSISCNQGECSRNIPLNEHSNLEEISEIQHTSFEREKSVDIEMEQESENASTLTEHVRNSVPNVYTNRQKTPKAVDHIQRTDGTLNESTENASFSELIDARPRIIRVESVGDPVNRSKFVVPRGTLQGSNYRMLHGQHSERRESNPSNRNVANSSNFLVPDQSLVRSGRGRVKTGNAGTDRIRNVSTNNRIMIRNTQFCNRFLL